MAGERVLIVDDEKSMCQFLSIMLRKEGYQITAVNNGKKALEQFKKSKFDLVITDVVMPNGSGSVVIDWLRRERPDIPVLVMSGYTEDEQVRRGVSTGELPFLRKPFSAADLVLATREVLQNTDPATTS